MLNYQRVTWVCIIMFRIYLFYRVINWGYLILGWDFSTYVHINGCVLHKHEDPNLNNTVQNTYTVIWHAYCVYIYIFTTTWFNWLLNSHFIPPLASIYHIYIYLLRYIIMIFSCKMKFLRNFILVEGLHLVISRTDADLEPCHSERRSGCVGMVLSVANTNFT
jgi:hypothetical protein